MKYLRADNLLLTGTGPDLDLTLSQHRPNTAINGESGALASTILLSTQLSCSLGQTRSHRDSKQSFK